MPGLPGFSPTLSPSTPSLPTIPPPDVTWVSQTAQSLIPLPGSTSAEAEVGPFPGMMPSSSQIQAAAAQAQVVAQYQAGVTAFQQLTSVHSILRTPIMVSTFGNVTDEDNFFYEHAGDLETLCTLLIPVPVQTVVDMVNYLQSLNATASYPPDEMVSLVEKLILGENVSFPTIEPPARIVNFLSKVLRTIVTGKQETVLMLSQDALRKKLYAAIDALSQAQADFEEAVLEANVPASVTDPVAWAGNLLSLAANSQASSILSAQSEINQAQSALQAVQNQIQATNESLASLQATLLTPDELAQYLLSNLDESSEAFAIFQGAYYEIEASITLYHQLTDPIAAQMTSITSSMVPAQNAVLSATSNYNTARAAINYANETHVSPTPAQMATFNSAQAILAGAQAALAPYQANLAAAQAALQAVFAAHPEFLVEGLLITDERVIQNLVLTALTSLATQAPASLMEVIQDAMQVEANAADQRTADLENEQSEMIQAKADAFQAFYQDQVEAKLAFYQNQMNLAQDAYNTLGGQLAALQEIVQKMQDEISANITALGGVIGWWTHENNLSDDVMSQPYFIGVALNSVVGLKGSYDVVQIPLGILGQSSQQTFWTGPGASSDLASQTITLMANQQVATDNYNMQSPDLIAQMNHLTAWMTQTQQAFQITETLLNSAAYAQSLQPEFSASPQGALLQSDIDAIVTPLRQITLQVASDQQTLTGILNDLEKSVLSQNGMAIGDLNALSYNDQKSLWVGVCDHLAGPGQRLSELQGYISAISGRIQAGQPDDGDPECLQAAQVALMNIIGAQNIQRTLSNNLAFMAQLQSDADTDTTAALAAASGAAS